MVVELLMACLLACPELVLHCPTVASWTNKGGDGSGATGKRSDVVRHIGVTVTGWAQEAGLSVE
eukprot:1881768-Rhodomonas_salina.1